jgi:hypothetical protein
MTVLIFSEGDCWFAQCLEHDFVATGGDPHTAMVELRHLLAARVLVAQELGLADPFDVKPPPKAFIEKYQLARDWRQGAGVEAGEVPIQARVLEAA